MRLRVVLPKNRWEHGSLWLMGGDAVVLGPFDCRGKADNAAAAKAGNPPVGSPSQRDPRKPFGDTPTGKWSACKIVARDHHRPGDGIGPIWIPLDRAHAADEATKMLLHLGPDMSDPLHKGRQNLGIHAGRGDADLVATNGCLRVHDRTMKELQGALRATTFDVEIVEAPEAKRGAAAA